MKVMDHLSWLTCHHGAEESVLRYWVWPGPEGVQVYNATSPVQKGLTPFDLRGAGPEACLGSCKPHLLTPRGPAAQACIPKLLRLPFRKSALDSE